MEPSQLPHNLITALVCAAPCSYPITPQMCPGDAMTHSSWLKRQTTFTSCCWSEVLRSAKVEGGNKHRTFRGFFKYILNIYFGGLMNLKSCGAGWGKLTHATKASLYFIWWNLHKGHQQREHHPKLVRSMQGWLKMQRHLADKLKQEVRGSN